MRNILVDKGHNSATIKGNILYTLHGQDSRNNSGAVSFFLLHCHVSEVDESQLKSSIQILLMFMLENFSQLTNLSLLVPV